MPLEDVPRLFLIFYIARSSFDQTPEPRRLSLDAGSTDSSSDALVAAYVVGGHAPHRSDPCPS